MRRLLHLVLAAALLIVPLPVLAAGKKRAPSSTAHTKKAKAAPRQANEAARPPPAAEATQASSDLEKTTSNEVGQTSAEPAADATVAPPEPTAREAAPQNAEPPPAQADEASDAAPAALENPGGPTTLQRILPPRRYAYLLGAVVGAAGGVVGYLAQAEAKRAETIGSAPEAQRAFENARASAALANVMYGLAAAAVVIALVLELIPEPVAEKAALTFHF